MCMCVCFKSAMFVIQFLETPCRKLRLSDNGQLLLNLCFALLGLYIFFILAIHTTAVTGLCMLVAALLQYFFLVTFMAMAAEAINLYMKLVVVLGSKISYYCLKSVVVCWGKQMQKHIVYILSYCTECNMKFSMSTCTFTWLD